MADVLVRLICKETAREKDSYIRQGFNNQTWTAGSKVKVPKTWFDSIPSSNERSAATTAVAATECPHCAGTGTELTGEIFGSYEDELRQDGEIVAAAKDFAKIQNSVLANPQAQQAALQREQARQLASPEKPCSHCGGTGQS
jgi:hypothetical protein